jgi:hypothetical protein
MTTLGRSLELYFIDGQPDGMLTAEVFNWTGHVLRIPRNQIQEGLKRPEASHTGIYILIGEDKGRPLAYIGEAEELKKRIADHVKNKPWWNQVVLVSTSADVLHKAHIKFLESRLVSKALKIGAIDLENGNVPPQSSLTEAAQANMESFLETLDMVLPAIRIDFLLDKASSSNLAPKSQEVSQKPKLSIVNNNAGTEAFAEFRGADIVVLAGSIIRDRWVGKGSWDSGYRQLREQLIKSGTVIQKEEGLTFEEDYAFSSLSASAAVVLGRASNGRIEWKVSGTNQTYADWEVANLSENPTTSIGVKQ